MNLKIPFLLFGIFFLFFACSAPDYQVKTVEFPAQGTTCKITYYAIDSLNRHGIDSIINLIDNTFSVYNPVSEISLLNDSEKGETASLLFRRLIEYSRRLHKKSHGKFDISLYPLYKFWGFDKKKAPHSLNADSLNIARDCCGMDKFTVRNDSVIKFRECLKLDMNAIAQGFTIDLLAEYLESNRILCYMIELGGEIRCGRAKPDDTEWNIGIELPPGVEISSSLTFPIKSASVSTSGSWRKFYIHNGKPFSHIIDPESGMPAGKNILSATVICPKCIDADGLSTVLMLFDPEEAISFIENIPDTEALIILLEKKDNWSIKMSEGFLLSTLSDGKLSDKE